MSVIQACQSQLFNGQDFFKLLVKLLVASLEVQLVENLPAMQGTPVQSLGQEDPLEKGYATHCSILWLLLWLSW